ncbi:helix-turn-helix domain-containing protein [Candidatus Accumulibacter contiguus]|jgi:hypothetical protein|nr:helix-turn-helix domain-containing protein [Accumulibacter sp.]HRF13641.1 helix-turn-helix domain-containing protein [Candidatus Accumulibacter phosphatis]
MRFEEAYGGWEAGRLTQAEASSLLGVCERTFRRYLMRYEADGLEGLLDRRLEQVSHRKAPVDEVMDLLSTYRRRHEGWNAKHFYAWYRKRVSRNGGGPVMPPAPARRQTASQSTRSLTDCPAAFRLQLLTDAKLQSFRCHWRTLCRPSPCAMCLPICTSG